MSHFGILSSFDHNVTDWKTYKSRLTQWLIANDINAKSDESGVKRRAILLTLPKELQDLPYADILQLLDKHFTPKTCGFSERFKFYAASQQQGETYPQWAARLRGLTAHCGSNDVEEALRDRFVMGMIAGPEREKLFAQEIKDLTLAKAVEMAESIRCARTAAGPSSSFQPDPVFKIAHKGRNNSATVRSEIKCSVCGRSNHKSSQCRFANYKCNKCNEKGHLRKIEDDDDGKFFYIRSVRGEPMVESISINQTSYKFEIDSGSAVTMSLSTARKRLMTYTGRHIECVGVARLPVSYLQQTHDIDIHVVRDGGPPLLGRDFISSKLQQQYSLLFSDKLGTFKKYKIKLLMQDNAKPIFFKARPIAFALRDKVEKEIDRLVTLGVLKPVEYSEYASPVVPVLKRNGSVRLCADYSVSLNKQLLVEKYPLPTVNELFSKLHGARVFSKIDLSMAYNQCVLDDESQALTCINTHRGLYKYTRLVFGLASAPAIFQRVMENVLSGLEGVLCMLDDVCIFSFDEKSHLNRLNAVFKRLEDSGFTLQKEKCDFFKDEIGYSGHIISKDGIKKAPEKVKAMTDAPIPSNVSQLQSFLGLVNYYRNFVPNASSVLSPLYDLLKKGCKWNWTQEHDLAFQTIKSLLTSEQTLAHFNPNAKIILTVDASPSGLGAILSQVDADGVERPISFASRTAEKRYAQIQKEETAIIYGVRRFNQYLYGRSEPFILRTDHKPLISIFGPYNGIPEVSANRLQRYALFLSGYNYKIEYIRSGDNNADYLSRASLPEPSGPPGSRHTACACTERCGESETTCDRATYVCFVVDGTMPVTLRKVREATNNDMVLSRVASFILNGWPPKIADVRLKPFYLCRNQLSLESGCVMRGHKVVIPESLHV
ncbi:hypothetical protein ABMA27_003143 [Loxostege sticticalis]|uniref:Reverse transcriptase domain-containing protein n=1 Tax=Loxostege sticticalis TaxID=481309 RepID=A0ABR3HS51_LOXSC